jgi:hypothetical protein
MKRRAAQVDIHTAKEKDHVANVKLLGSARKIRELSLVLEEARWVREEAERQETLAMREVAGAMDAKMADEIEAKGAIQALRDAEHMFLLAQAEEAGVKRMYADITFHEDDVPGASEDQSARMTSTSADPSSPEAADFSPNTSHEPLPSFSKAHEEEEYDEGLGDSTRKLEEIRPQELDQVGKRTATLSEEEKHRMEEEARKQKKAAKKARKREERERLKREEEPEEERHA